MADADARFVMVGEDTVVELVHPRDPSSLAARELDTVGQCVIGVTFKVRDIGRAVEHLTRQSAPVLTVAEHEILLDRERTWNTDYRFTDVGLVGDPTSRCLIPAPRRKHRSTTPATGRWCRRVSASRRGTCGAGTGRGKRACR